MSPEELREGMVVKFSPPRWGKDVGKVVQFSKDVILECDGTQFIREFHEIVEEVA